MKITDLEKKTLINIAENLLTSLNGGIPSEPFETNTWTNCISDNGPFDLNPMSTKGALGSLTKKGLIDQGFETTQLTEAGFEIYKSFNRTED